MLKCEFLRFLVRKKLDLLILEQAEWTGFRSRALGAGLQLLTLEMTTRAVWASDSKTKSRAGSSE